MARHTNWTEELNDSLRVLFENDYSDEEIMEVLKIPHIDRVKRQRLALGLRRTPPKGGNNPLQQCEIEFLFENQTLSSAAASRELAKKFGTKPRDPWAIYEARRRLDLPTTNRRDWTKDEDDLIRRYYPGKGAKPISDRTGWPIRSVQYRASKLGIKYDRYGKFKGTAYHSQRAGAVSLSCEAIIRNKDDTDPLSFQARDLPGY